MLSSWFSEKPITKIGFEDILYALKQPDRFLMINTLSSDSQDVLIRNTVIATKEEYLINNLLSSNKNDTHIILYGRNSSDNSTDKKFTQLVTLGFTNVVVYSGGLFEWILLQDIYGTSEFPTTSIVTDIIKYRPIGIFNTPLLHNAV
jgi:hypothetical protein